MQGRGGAFGHIDEWHLDHQNPVPHIAFGLPPGFSEKAIVFGSAFSQPRFKYVGPVGDSVDGDRILMRRARQRSIFLASSITWRISTDVVIVRPFNHAGPRQSPRYVLASLAPRWPRWKPGSDCVEVGNLDVVRDFTDVRDVVRAYRLLAPHGQPGEIYNLGSGRGTKIADTLEYLRSIAKMPIPVRS